MDAPLRSRVLESVTVAMKARDSARVSALRLIASEIKKVEVNERVEVTDARLIQILSQMLKQRQESIAQYEKANRQDLVDVEAFEVALIKEFMPQPVSMDDARAMVQATVQRLGATSVKDMGAVMAALKPELQGKIDLSEISKMIKELLAP
ncbi:MAG: GatB/YqeY domain-containing protein [Pseudomonadota bacterium]